MLKHLSFALSVASALLLSACGGDDGNSTSPAAAPKNVANVAVPNVGATTAFSFDIGTVLGSKYYFTDRNNAGVDAIDIPSPTYSTLTVQPVAFPFPRLGPKR